MRYKKGIIKIQKDNKMHIEFKNNKFSVFADRDDVCMTCFNNQKCPLVGALVSECVILRCEKVHIENCGLYKRNKVGIWTI